MFQKDTRYPSFRMSLCSEGSAVVCPTEQFKPRLPSASEILLSSTDTFSASTLLPVLILEKREVWGWAT